VQDIDGTVRTFTITSEDVAPAPVNRTEIIDTPTGKVGYVLFNTFGPFESEASLQEAFTQLETEAVDDLVLDLRYNGGGLVVVAAQLGYMIAGPERTDGKTASLLQYNEAAGNTNPTTGEVQRPFPFIDTGVGFSLSTSTDLTCGKPYGFLPTDNCGTTYYTIQFQSVNDKGFGDYSDGFSPADSTNTFSEQSPGCTVSDDISKELGDPEEALLSTALYYRDNDSCPVTASASAKTYVPAAKTRQSVLDGYQLKVGNDPFDTSSSSYLDATLPAKTP